MKLKLEEKDNKTLVGIFPGILDEVRNNIRDVRGANANAIAPNEDEQKVITANENYAKSMEDILWFGEDALIILQHYRSEITDLSAMLYIIKGFSIYRLQQSLHQYWPMDFLLHQGKLQYIWYFLCNI